MNITFSETLAVITDEIKANYTTQIITPEYIGNKFQKQLDNFKMLLMKDTTQVLKDIEKVIKEELENENAATPTLRINILYAYFRLNLIFFTYIAKKPEIYKTPSVDGTKKLLEFAFDRRLPSIAVPVICEIMSLSTKIIPETVSIVFEIVKNSPKNINAPTLWTSVIHSEKEIDEGFSVLAEMGKKIPKTSYHSFCIEICKAFNNAITENSSSFTNNLHGASILYPIVKSWGDVDLNKTLLILVLCMPEDTKKGEYKKLFKEISSNLSKGKNKKQEITQITPLLHAITVTKGTNKFYVGLHSEICSVLLKAVTEFIKSLNESFIQDYLISLLYTEKKEFSNFVNLIQSNDLYQGAMLNAVLMSQDQKIPELSPVIRYLVEKNTEEIFKTFSTNPRFFNDWMFMSEENGELITKKVLETKSEDLLQSLSQFFKTVDGSYKVKSVISLVKMLHQIIKKKLFEEISGSVDNTISIIASICEYLTRAIKSGQKLAEVDKIIMCFEPTIYMCITTTSQTAFDTIISLIESITKICKLVYKPVQPFYAELVKVLNASSNHTLENPAIRNTFYSIKEVNAQVKTILIYMFNAMQPHTQTILTGTNNQTKLTNQELLNQWINCLTLILFLPCQNLDDIVAHVFSCFRSHSPVVKRIISAFSYACRADAMKMLLEKYLAGSDHQDYSNPEIADELSNIILCISRYIEQPRANQYVIDTNTLKSLIQLALNIGTNGLTHIPLRTNLCHFVQLINPKQIDELDADLRATFVNRVSQWISQNVILYYYESGDDSLINGVGALGKATKNLKLNPDVIKNCVTALVLVLKNHEETAYLVETVITNVFKENTQKLVEISFGLVLSENTSVRTTFFNVFSKANVLSPAIMKKIKWPKTAIDLALDPPFAEIISDKIIAIKADIISMIMIKAATIKKVDEDFLKRMVDLELRDTTDENKNMVLRGNCICTRVIGNYAKILGVYWVNSMFVEPTRYLNNNILKGMNYEINPAKGETNPQNLLDFLVKLQGSIMRQFEKPPPKIVFFIKTLYQKLTEKLGDFGFTLTFGFFFLRFIFPIISVPENLMIDFKLEPKTKEALLTASVILMSAVNKGDLNEKKPFYHFFNNFSAKTREESIAAMKKLLTHELTIVEKAKITKMFDFNEIVVENDLVKQFSNVFDLIRTTFPVQPEYKRVVNHIKEYHFSQVGKVPKLNRDYINTDAEGILEILDEEIPEQVKELVAGAFIRISDNLIVFNRSRLPVLPLTHAFIYHVLSVFSEQREEYSIVFDCTPSVNSEPCIYLNKCFDIIMSALLPDTTEKLKEVALINASEELIKKMDETIIKKKVINAEKCVDFDKKYIDGFEHFNHDFTEPLSSSTATVNGQQVTTILFKKYICTQKIVNQRICSSIIKYSTIDKVEQNNYMGSHDNFMKQDLVITFGNKKQTISACDQTFTTLLSNNIWKAPRYNRMCFDPLNLKLLMNIARVINNDKPDDIIAQEKGPLFSEILALSHGLSEDFAYSILEKVDEVYNIKSVKQNEDVYNYIMRQRN